MSHLTQLPQRPPRTSIRWFLLLLAVLVVLSFITLDLQLAVFFEPGSVAKMQEFIGGFFPPVTEVKFLKSLARAGLETIAMSLIGTVLAALISLSLAVAAANTGQQSYWRRVLRSSTRLVLVSMRSVPELVWASLLVIAAGLGPFPGTLALALHTTGVLGRLFADTLENIPTAPAQALRDNGTHALAAFSYATLPLALPQMLSYTLYLSLIHI